MPEWLQRYVREILPAYEQPNGFDPAMRKALLNAVFCVHYEAGRTGTETKEIYELQRKRHPESIQMVSEASEGELAGFAEDASEIGSMAAGDRTAYRFFSAVMSQGRQKRPDEAIDCYELALRRAKDMRRENSAMKLLRKASNF